jgi:hypothetical protein
LPNLTFHSNLAALEFDQTFGNGKANTGAHGILVLGCGRSPEALKDVGQFVRVNTRFRIFDGNPDLGARFPGREGDVSPMSMFDGITQQIDENLFEAIAFLF